MLSRNKILAAIMLSNGISTAIAQETSNTYKETSNTQSLEVITVYGRHEGMTVKDVPQTVSVFDEESFDIGLFDTVGDALRLVPNATRSGSSQDMFADDYLFRGFDAEQSINGLGFIQTDHPTDLANVERIEILKGPASIFYGQMEPGGTINVVTKQPLSDFQGEVGLEYGSHARKRTTIDVTGPLSNSVRARLNLAYQDSDSHIDFLNHQRLFIAPNVTMDFSDRTNLTIEGSYSSNEWIALNGGTPIEGAILSNPNGDYGKSFNPAWEDAYTERESQYINVRLTQAITDNISARASYSYNRNDADFQEYAPFGLDEADSRTLSRIIFASRDAYKKDHNVIFDVTGEFETGVLTHKFIVGLDYRASDASRPTEVYFINAIDLYDPQYGPVDWDSAAQVRDRSTLQYDDVAAFFVQDRITVAERLHLLAGLRYIESRQSQETLDNLQGTFEDDVIDQDDWTTQLGVIYDLGQKTSVYASRSESFVPQQGTTRGQKPLEAEQSTQYEAGVRMNAGGLQANAAVFEITKENTAISPSGLDYEVAQGKARSSGAELSVSGDVTSNWYLSAAYGYTNTEMLRSDDPDLEENRFANIPYHTASLQTRYHITSIPGFSLGGTASYTGERFGDDYNTFTMPSYTRLDLAAYYEVSRAVQVDLLVNNVLDEEIFSPGAFSGIIREPGRTFLARVSYTF